MDAAFELLTPEELAALDAAVAVIQAECEYCARGVPGLLERMAVDMLHTGQLLAACRGLPSANTTRASKIELMTRKHEGLLYWEPLFHPRSRKICRACQLATRRCVSIWQVARG